MISPNAAVPAGLRLILLVLLSVLAGACESDQPDGMQAESPPPTATPTAVVQRDVAATEISEPRVVRVAVPAGLRDLFAGLLPWVPHDFEELRLVDENVPAGIRVVVSDQMSADPVIRRWSVVSAASRIDLNGVSMASVEQAIRDGRLFVAAEHLTLTEGFFAGAGAIKAVPGEALPETLAATPDSFALVPVDAVSVQVRALALDGIDPVRGEGDQRTYPLMTRGRVIAVDQSPKVAAVVARIAHGLAQAERPPLRVTFTGDLIPARCAYDQMRRLGDWAAPFRTIGERLRGADLTVGSLDAAISGSGRPIGCRQTFSLLAPPEAVQGLVAGGFDLLSVATNHVKDCGESGPCGDTTFFDTLALLRAAGIAPAGGGQNLAEARQPLVLTAGGVRFAFLAYDDVAAYYHATETAAGTAPLDETTLVEDIQAARTVADVVVVLPQWGEEYTPDPTERQQRIAALAIDNGATLVAGNHPHVVQAAAPRGDGYVAYALGNLVFDQDWSRETMEGVVLETTFHGPRLVAVRFVPYRIEGQLEPVPVEGEAAMTILRRIMTAAEALQ
jgi:poly-gamma-glutamate synthesis protein (capsule biosynthesis protein)